MKKVLLADDYNAIKRIYFDLLKKNYLVEACNDAGEILLRVQRFKPDIILVNSDLPNFDPHEFCEVVSGRQKIPTVLVTRRTSANTININNCRADSIIAHPLDNKEVLEVISRLVNHA